mmetsp:Transcript_3351/g.10464  ORF Transcript_3351/g.10464 Transcript_3351/m.10464 type:complete len:209 (+) Transcript_3351:481-1107(+)
MMVTATADVRLIRANSTPVIASATTDAPKSIARKPTACHGPLKKASLPSCESGSVATESASTVAVIAGSSTRSNASGCDPIASASEWARVVCVSVQRSPLTAIAASAKIMPIMGKADSSGGAPAVCVRPACSSSRSPSTTIATPAQMAATTPSNSHENCSTPSPNEHNITERGPAALMTVYVLSEMVSRATCETPMSKPVRSPTKKIR